jgi:peptidoglycan/xylan/chitin deacetylase (PgdA/CDA1 family)
MNNEIIMNLFFFIPGLILTIGLTGLGIAPWSLNYEKSTVHNVTLTALSPLFATPTATPTPTQIPTPTPSPTPRPLSFSEMNLLYGPCAYVPVLFWHHIQDMGKAKELGHAQLTVATDVFRNQMQYLRDHGYTTIRPEQLIAFFDTGVPLPPKPILLTVDDGYDDFASDAAPIIREFGFQITIFLPTGLLNNPGFMSWDTVSQLGTGNFYFANHTWSHHNVNATEAIDEREITTADTQLSQRGLNPAKVFSYPYGFSNNYAIGILERLGYKLAFTTYPGSVQCAKHRFTLPRTRIGNGSLSAYGL